MENEVNDHSILHPGRHLSRSIFWLVIILLLMVGVLVIALVFSKTNQEKQPVAATPVNDQSQSLEEVVVEVDEELDVQASPTAYEQTAQPTASPTRITSAQNTPPLLLKGIGFELAKYDPTTGMAGDMRFTKEKLQFDRLWMDYAFTIPADVSASGNAKRNPQPTFILPLGTKVRSLVDGVVVNITKLYSDDYSIMVASDTKSQWMYETEHVVNPVVKVGDKVTAGQVVAEVANFNNNTPVGFGLFEIGILQGGNPPQHVCPFAYLDPSVKDTIQANIQQLYNDWEAYTGKSDLYNPETMPMIGCETLDPIEG